MKFSLFICFAACLIFAECLDVGQVSIEVDEGKGLKVIYDPGSEPNKGSRIHLNINKDLPYSEDGEIQGELEKKGDKFVYENTETKVEEGDKVHFRVGCYGDKIGNCKIEGQYEYKGAGSSSDVDESSLRYSCVL